MTGLQRRPEVVFLDFNYTLAGFARPMLHYEAIAARLELPIDQVRPALQRYEDRYETGLDPAIRMQRVLRDLHIRPDLDPELVDKLIRLEQNSCLEAVELYPGVRELLEWLEDQDIARILVCNGNPNAKLIAKQLGVLARCTHAVFSCDDEVKSKKPEAPIYRYAMSLVRVPEAACLYVGDGGDYELWGVHQAFPEMPRVWVDHEIDGQHRDPNDLRLRIEREYTIDHIADLRGLLEPAARPT